MNALQRLELFLTGKAYVGHRRKPGWAKPHPFFAFKCSIHGIVEDYFHGFEGNEYLNCPRCQIEGRHPKVVEEVVEEVLSIEER